MGWGNGGYKLQGFGTDFTDEKGEEKDVLRPVKRLQRIPNLFQSMCA
jgi:hypothetical protein